MADLDDLTAFAAAKRHNLTNPLTHQQVVTLAEAWIPEFRFHELERFHPIDVRDVLTVPPPIFNNLSTEEQERLRVQLPTSTDAEGNVILERFDPPVVHAKSGSVRLVAGAGADAVDAMDNLEDLRNGSEYTHGSNLTASLLFFGASTTVNDDETPEAGDPRVPRHLPIVVHAELRMLLETLKHELQLDELPGALADHGRPIDAIWSGFDVEESFFEETGDAEPARFLRSEKRDILAAVILAYEAGNSAAERAARESAPTGWRFVDKAWDIVKRFAFLEYYLFYAFNDYEEYGTGPFENEHEGDVEGCCVVFEREQLEEFASGDTLVAEIYPHSLITVAHEPDQDLDDIKRLSKVPTRARTDLLVYVAAGSHGSYLTADDHDIVDWEDILTDIVPPEVTLGLLLLTGPEITAMAMLLLGFIEQIIDAEDFTSDNGASIGPGDQDLPNLKFDKRILVTPLSDFVDSVNIYQDTPAQRARLPIRGFRGKWGGDDSLFDKSPAWRNKTARYFRKFMGSANIEPEGPIVD